MSKRIDRSQLSSSTQQPASQSSSTADSSLKPDSISPPSARKRRTSGPVGHIAASPLLAVAGLSSAMEGQGESSSSASMQPPAKKSRTNTPWTAAEEQRLKNMREAGNSWADIAKTFPSRTEGSVKKHWYKDMHYAEFAEDESAALLNAIKEYETNKWKVIGQKVGKPAKACEQYAKEHFGNNLKS